MSDRRASLSRVIPITTDTGTGYGRPPPTSRRELAEVGPGTSMGELLRRYWHPVGLAADAASVPRKVRALGEDLVLFRDGQQRPGLVLPHCIHRGASLFYGTTEERGIRCCDHGWLFDVHGHCLEQPWEPGGGRARDKLRQPWYPVQELYGLLWAYMGPPEKKPVLPRYECLEVLDEGEFLEADDSSLGGGGPAVVDCNWLQHFETLVDPFHGTAPHPAQAGAAAAAVSDVSWDTTEISVRAVALHRLPDGRKWRRISEAGLPTLRVVPDPRPGRLGPVESVGWALPIDDTHF
ncbi:MAG: Rieske 2Fe-2S domain-containing protein, partial [Ramlibacter sp.]